MEEQDKLGKANTFSRLIVITILYVFYDLSQQAVINVPAFNTASLLVGIALSLYVLGINAVKGITAMIKAWKSK